MSLFLISLYSVFFINVERNGVKDLMESIASIPLMLMYNSSYQTAEAKETSYLPNINAFNNATDTAYSLCIKDSGHLNFTDLPRISPFLAKMLGVGDVDSLKCIEIVNDYSLAFFDKHLKGQASPLIDGAEGFAEAEFEKRVPDGK